ncbi:hypothetical protein [Actinomadura sp. HBU206391]|uniref:hypothetical protein n=1 Tax=Actinomadura sp. HBU206391 TaxID=2731692 RepID=UPI0016505D77|nr:hypothetical protein [Actinomadura sp. HBU206391]MBC6462147.1 hypothetical protein [Actinomadura sp. HBU206391]
MLRKVAFIAIAMLLGASLAPHTTTAANALPPGWFHLRGTVRDQGSPFALRSMDVAWPPDGRITGIVRLNASGFAKDSQLWKEVFPQGGSIDQIKLKNKLTGQCIAGAVERAPIPMFAVGVTIRPCSDDQTVWQKIPMGANKYVFRRKSYNYWCLIKDGPAPEVLALDQCDDDFTPQMVWEAYKSG